MQTAADELSDSYHQAIRTGIGETLRTLFVPMEPPPERLLELLHALDQPKGGEDSKKRAGDTPEKPVIHQKKSASKRSRVATSCATPTVRR
jgi:hypothetical protein